MSDAVTIQDIYDLFRASQQEADRRAAEADRRAAEAKAEADRRAAEADRRLAQLEKMVADNGRQVAGLTTRWGQFVENFVAPAVLCLFQERGIEIRQTSRRVTSTIPEARMEIDILAVDGDVAVAIEVKSRLSQEDVDNFCQKLQNFKLAFPYLSAYQIHGAVAAIEIVQDVDRYAYRRGLFVIRQCGDSVEIANDSAFKPRAW